MKKLLSPLLLLASPLASRAEPDDVVTLKPFSAAKAREAQLATARLP